MTQTLTKAKELLEKIYGTTIIVRKERTQSNTDHMNKLLFISVVSTLRDLVANSSYLRDEIGIDISGLEEQYYQAIDGLLRMSFTDSQVQIINYYIYEVPNDSEFEAKIEVKERKKTQTYSFKTPEDLWEALKFVK